MTLKCEFCEKEAETKEALEQHEEAKHPETIKKPLFSEKNEKMVFKWLIIILILALIGAGLYYWGHQAKQEPEIIANITATLLAKIPTTHTHWHPHLTIIIDNETYPIPAGIGHGIGKAVDTQYGMDAGMAPTHTHDASGTIHLENLNPRAKPETFALGYFFYVWDKEFSKNCIFEYCTDKGTLTMRVNGAETDEFENYIMQDLDEIVIMYTSFALTNTTQ